MFLCLLSSTRVPARVARPPSSSFPFLSVRHLPLLMLEFGLCPFGLILLPPVQFFSQGDLIAAQIQNYEQSKSICLSAFWPRFGLQSNRHQPCHACGQFSEWASRSPAATTAKVLSKRLWWCCQSCPTHGCWWSSHEYGHGNEP